MTELYVARHTHGYESDAIRVRFDAGGGEGRVHYAFWDLIGGEGVAKKRIVGRGDDKANETKRLRLVQHTFPGGVDVGKCGEGSLDPLDLSAAVDKELRGKFNEVRRAGGRFCEERGRLSRKLRNCVTRQAT